MADRLTVTLEWRDDWFFVGNCRAGQIFNVWGNTMLEASVLAGFTNGLTTPILGLFPSTDRSAAMRAVEQAVRKALGAEGGGDA